jgi:DNA-binding MarR family transcriptional regulator
MTPTPGRSDADLESDLDRLAAFRTQLRRYLHKTKAVTARAGLTPERYDLLLMVKAAADGSASATVGTLRRSLDLQQTAVTELVKRAIDVGLLTRERSPADGRVFLLRLTEEGEARLRQVFDALATDRAEFVEAFELLRTSFHA